ncbi:peptide/nickel transport system ATP-binding protein [Frankia sp. EI5c]|uniref:ABC transporter ATP-binding protein n=1 Tax=Frankia sp. EI5c TaxID=683316 RepID=UPI0007C3BE31|nr:dipeptide/oligopeptide/nickel ABC transporter ATP-binding protein [Frankia sp. EI5c]OAA27951.1 peptide/nickel transport system ATP-binding protein [Frankia sp. EI5c]
MSALLDVEDLIVEYPAGDPRGRPVAALRGVSLDVRAGECLGVVGGRGSGTATLSDAVLGLAPVASGAIRFKGQDIARLSQGRRRRLDEKIQAVSRDPYSSLNPLLTVEASLAEPLRAERVPAGAAARRVRELLNQVGLPAGAGARLPGELSDDQRRRVAFARALTLSPELVICDDPVSALAPTARSEFLELLITLQETTGTAYVFISDDLALVRQISHHVAVMDRGAIAERGTGYRETAVPPLAYARRAPAVAPAPNRTAANPAAADPAAADPVGPIWHDPHRQRMFRRPVGRTQRQARCGCGRGDAGGLPRGPRHRPGDVPAGFRGGRLPRSSTARARPARGGRPRDHRRRRRQ